MSQLAAELVDQMTARDAAVLTWMGILTLAVSWSVARGGDVGQSVLDILRQLIDVRILGVILLPIAWQLCLVWAAAQIGLWNVSVLKDTIIIVTVSGLAAGFKALALSQGKQTWRGQLRALLAVVVALQWFSNLETFPYLVELLLLPLAVLLGGMQAVANHGDEYVAVRPFINGLITLFGILVIAWSAIVVFSSWSSRELTADALGFALAFWLPAATLPVIYAVAVVMEYGSTFSRMKVLGSSSIFARLDVIRHHRFNLARLHRFTRARGAVHEYSRASTRTERLDVLRGVAKNPAD